MSKAENKHHEKRLKAKRSGYSRCANSSEKGKGKIYQTPAICSCIVCRNHKKESAKRKQKILKEVQGG